MSTDDDRRWFHPSLDYALKKRCGVCDTWRDQTQMAVVGGHWMCDDDSMVHVSCATRAREAGL